MAMFENFPYTDMHNLNLDWIIKIAKDFLDQYTHIQELISNGEQSLQDLTDEGLQELDAKASELQTLLQQWYDTHSQDIAAQLAQALSDLNTWYSNHTATLEQLFNTKIYTFETEAQRIARETIATIPADYSALADNVAYLMKGTDPLKKYRIEGVSIDNIIQPIHPTYGGNVVPEVYMTGYDASGNITTGVDSSFMTLVNADIHNKWKITIPKAVVSGVTYQYVIITNENEKGILNIPANMIDSYSADWYEALSDRVIIDCEKLLIDYPTAFYIFISVPNSDTLKYVYDNKYTGNQFIPYSGETYKTLNWLEFIGQGGWSGKKICTYGDSLMNQTKTIENGSEELTLYQRIKNRTGATVYDRSFPGSSISRKLQATTAWVSDSAIQENAELILYRANPDGGTLPTGISVINNTFCDTDRIATIPADSDVVLIMGGYNDTFFKGSSLLITENVTQGDEAWFTYAYARTIERIQTRCPNATIILIIEPWCTSLNSYAETWNNVTENIHWLGNYYHIPVIDLNNSSTFNYLNAPILIKQDGTHPTMLGDAILTNHIAGNMKLFSPSAIDPAYTTPEDIGAIPVTAIRNNLETTSPGYVLDARQGAALKELADTKIPTANIVNNLTETSAGKVLDARQGKWLRDYGFVLGKSTPTNFNATLMGRFFGNSEDNTGLPTSGTPKVYYDVLAFGYVQFAWRWRPGRGALFARDFVNDTWSNWVPVNSPEMVTIRDYTSVATTPSESVTFDPSIYAKIVVQIGWNGGAISNFIEIPTNIIQLRTIEQYRLYLNNIGTGEYLGMTAGSQGLAIWSSNANVYARIDAF